MGFGLRPALLRSASSLNAREDVPHQLHPTGILYPCWLPRFSSLFVQPQEVECTATAKGCCEPRSCSDMTVKRGTSGCSFKANACGKPAARRPPLINPWTTPEHIHPPEKENNPIKRPCTEGDFLQGWGQGSRCIQSLLLGGKLAELPLCLHAWKLNEAFYWGNPLWPEKPPEPQRKFQASCWKPPETDGKM